MKIKPFKPIVLSWLPALAGMGALFYASSLPGDRIHLPPFPYSDKVVHFSAYTLLGLLLSVRNPLRRRLYGSAIAAPAAGGQATAAGTDFTGMAVGMLYGVSDEIHQLFVPLRSYDYADMTADALGVGLGCWLFGRLTGRIRSIGNPEVTHG